MRNDTLKALIGIGFAAIVIITGANAKAAGEISGRNDRSNHLVQVINAVKAGRSKVVIAANPGEVTPLQIKVAVRDADDHYGNVVVKTVGVGKFKVKWLKNGNFVKKLIVELNGLGHEK
jgi:hypothetical protein